MRMSTADTVVVVFMSFSFGLRQASLASWSEQHPGHHVPAKTGRQSGAVKPAAPQGGGACAAA